MRYQQEQYPRRILPLTYGPEEHHDSREAIGLFRPPVCPYLWDQLESAIILFSMVVCPACDKNVPITNLDTPQSTVEDVVDQHSRLWCHRSWEEHPLTLQQAN